jgi:hypothetical protein
MKTIVVPARLLLRSAAMLLLLLGTVTVLSEAFVAFAWWFAVAGPSHEIADDVAKVLNLQTEIVREAPAAFVLVPPLSAYFVPR